MQQINNMDQLDDGMNAVFDQYFTMSQTEFNLFIKENSEYDMQLSDTDISPHGSLTDLNIYEMPSSKIPEPAVTMDSMHEFVAGLPAFIHISDKLLLDIYIWYRKEEETIDLTQDDDEEIIDLTQDEEDLE